MAAHLPIAAGIAGLVGVGVAAKAVLDGKDAGEALRCGLIATKDTALAIGTLGLISPDAGIDISDEGIAFDPDHSCGSDRIV
ncbi:hypothetical protein [Nostoc sp. ChiSLP03a]|uniref:hypothetical protein n=1 Tax=Nostoc sp. ChiSLP03a TaxID=3075380 RepID=UPI002AD276F7|nr:hypothetical protein [Nostoc sp. ChiSLP03a]MDZ8214517.1 hypothetical protein [Nostoc sp. ChiSLP03a]